MSEISKALWAEWERQAASLREPVSAERDRKPENVDVRDDLWSRASAWLEVV